MNKRIKKLMSILLTVVVLVSLLPTMDVFAAEGKKSTIGAEEILSLCNPIGRLVKQNNTVRMESSASNFTLTGTLEGDIVLDVTVEEKTDEYHNLFVEIDGEMHYFELAEGRQSVTIAKDLPAGRHRVQISKGPEAKKEVYYIHGVEYTGTLEKTAPAAHRMEFLGDSITAGTGVYFYDAGFGGTHSYFTYANMTADALGADYYSVANGGWKFSQSLAPNDSIGAIYEKVSMHDATLGAYDFSWQPEVIVINLGTNDAIAGRKNTAYTEETYIADAATLLDKVRKNNPDAQIIWVYAMMLTERKAWVQNAVEAYAENDSKVHYLELKGNMAGRGDHPNLDGHITAAQMLIEAISDLMGWEADPAKDPIAMRNKEKIATAARIQKEAATLDFSKNYCPACGEIDGWTKLGGDTRSYPGTTVGNAPTFSGNKHFYWDAAEYPTGVVNSTVYNWLQVNGSANVCLHLSGLTHNYSGRIHWGGNGTLNIMGAGSLNAAGKSNATTNMGNLYINSAGTINLYGGTFTSDDTVALNKPQSLTEGRYATLSVHNSKATVNIYDGVVMESTFGTNIAADIGTVNMYGGTLRGGKGYPYHAETITADTTDWETCGGNVYLYGQSNTKQAVFNLYGGTITGGAAAQGGNVFAYQNSVLNLYGGDVIGGAADTGKNIYVCDDASLEVGENWGGRATVAFETAYTYGDTIQNGSAAGDVTGKLLYESDEQPNIYGLDGKLVIAPVKLCLPDGSLCWQKDTAAALENHLENPGSYICTAAPNMTFVLPEGEQVCIDFNGMAATVTGSGILLGMDSQNDTYEATNCNVTATDTVRIQRDVTNPISGKRYIALTKDGVTTFHALDLRLSAVTLRTDGAGIYYKATLGCDDVLKAQIAAYGVGVSLQEEMPPEKVLYTRLSGAPADTFTSGSVANIFRGGLNAEKNGSRGAMKIYAMPYLELTDGTMLTARKEARSLQDVMQYLNENLGTLDAETLAAATAFYAKWSDAMESWALTNLQSVV